MPESSVQTTTFRNHNDQARTYRAFISYRHADNKTEGRQWATWIHQMLETYEVPTDLVGQKNNRDEEIPERIFPVFRDEEELPADADLSSPIYRALDNSEYLVVICSPRARQSIYVANEVAYFKQIGKSDRVLAMMIDGEPNTSLDAGKLKSGFSIEDECFPEPLQFEVNAQGEMTETRSEPIAADFRIVDQHSSKAGEGWTSPSAYREALKSEGAFTNQAINSAVKAYAEQLKLMKLKIIAGVLGVSLGELTKRDEAYQLEKERRKRRILMSVMGVVVALGVAAVIAAIIAGVQYQKAEANALEARKQEQQANTNANEANRQKNIAVVNEENAIYSAYIANIQLASQNINQGNILEAQEALMNCPAKHRDYEWQLLVNRIHKKKYRFPKQNTPFSTLLFNERNDVITSNEKGRITVHEHVVVDNQLEYQYDSASVMSGTRFDIGSSIGASISSGIEIYALDESRLNYRFITKSSQEDLFLSHTGKFLALAGPSSVSVYRLTNTEEQLLYDLDAPFARNVFFDETRDRIIVINDYLTVYALKEGGVLYQEKLPLLTSYSAVYEPKTQCIILSSIDGVIHKFDIGKKELVFNEKITKFILHHLYISPSGTRLIGISKSNQLIIYHLESMTELLSVDTGVENIEHTAISPDGMHLLLASNNTIDDIISLAPALDPSMSETKQLAELHFIELAKKRYLQAARSGGHDDLIRELTASGLIHPDITDDSGMSALNAAVTTRNNQATISTLLELGADVNMSTKQGNFRALTVACLQQDNFNNIKQLVEAGAEIDDKAFLGAVSTLNNEDVVKLFIQADGNIHAVDEDGRTALLRSAGTAGNHEVVKLLIESGAKSDIHKPMYSGSTPILEASKQKGNLETIKLLLQAGATLELNPTSKISPLLLATLNDDTELVKYLISQGASIHDRIPEGWTLLKIATRNINFELVQLFHKAGVPINARDNSGRTALMYACALADSVEIVEYLLENGADVKQQCNNSMDAILYNCAMNPNAEIIKRLLKHGADPRIRNQNNETLLAMLASKPHYRQATEVILQTDQEWEATGKTGLTPLMHAAHAPGNDWLVQVLIDKGADIHRRSKLGWTLVLLASRIPNNEKTLETILKAGVDPNVHTNKGLSPLMLAIEHKNTATLKLLVQYKANVNYIPSSGYSPLISACIIRNFDAVKILVQAGANLNYETEGFTALHIAIYKNHEPIVKYLVSKGAIIHDKDIDSCKDPKLKKWLIEQKAK